MVVALRKESVDRNTNFSGGAGQLIKSLSARRAWIEIEITLQTVLLVSVVALRKESVDRNYFPYFSGLWHGKSLSARRAWIEIETLYISLTTFYVALRKESVDRNFYAFRF